MCRLRRNQAGRATSFAQIGRLLRPAMDGCHCLVTAERGCDGNQLGSLWTPPPITWINAPLPLRRSRPGRAGREWSAAAASPQREPCGSRSALAARLAVKEQSFFLRAHLALPEGRSKNSRSGWTAGKKRCRAGQCLPFPLAAVPESLNTVSMKSRTKRCRWRGSFRTASRRASTSDGGPGLRTAFAF